MSDLDGQEREALEEVVKMTSLTGGLSWSKALERLTAVRKLADAALAAREEPQGDGMVRVFIDGKGYRVRPDVTGEFLLSLRPLSRAELKNWEVWQEAHPEDINVGWDRPLSVVGGERFYTTPKYITASAASEGNVENEWTAADVRRREDVLLDLSYQDAEHAAWSEWKPESPPDKRDAHCHGFDAGYKVGLAAREALRRELTPVRRCYGCGLPIPDGEKAIQAKTGNAWKHFECWYDGTPFPRDSLTGALNA